MPDELSKSFRNLLKKYQLATQATQARMGRPDGTLHVPGKTNQIYVTELDGPCVEVLNQRVFPEEVGKLVLIGYDPIHFPLRRQVLSRWDAYPEAGNLGVFPHADTHGIDSSDPVFISSRQYLDGLVVPISGSLAVQIYPDTYQTNSGYKRYDEVTILDFSASVPTAGARAALLVVDGNGDFVLRDGEIVGNYNLVDNTALPTPEPGDTVRYAIVCYSGQTEAVDTESQRDLIDLRSSARATARTLPATTAANDFLIGDGTNWLAKTLAQTIAILRASLDGVYSALVHNHSASQITSGTLDPARLPAIPSGLTIKEIDGTPTVENVAAIRVTNGKLTDDGDGQVTLDLSGGGGSGGGHEIQNDGVGVPQRAKLNFVGASISDDEANDATVVTLGGGSGAVSCKAYSSVDINYYTGAGWQVVPFDSNAWDTSGMHSTTTNPERFTCNVAGKYDFLASTLFETFRPAAAVSVRVNGVEVAYEVRQKNASDPYQTVDISVTLDLSVGDYVELYLQDNGANGKIIGSWGDHYTWASLTLEATPGVGAPPVVTKKSLVTRTVIQETVLTSAQATIDITGIDQGYDNLEVTLNAASTVSETYEAIKIRFSGYFGSNDYKDTVFWLDQSFSHSNYPGFLRMDIPAALIPGVFSMGTFTIPQYSLNIKHMVHLSSSAVTSGGDNMFLTQTVGYLDAAGAITRITFDTTNPGSSFAVGTRVQIIGVKTEDVVVNVSGGNGSGTGAGPLAYTELHGTDEPLSSRTLAELDPAASVTFLAPSSGKVLVRLSATCTSGSQHVNDLMLWGLREGDTDLTGDGGIVIRTPVAGQNLWLGVSKAFVISGLTSGYHTYKWTYLQTDGSGYINSDSGNPAIMEVWPLSTGPVGGSPGDYILIEEQAPAGTRLGELTAGSWQVRIPTVIVRDPGNHASLPGGGIIRLNAGTYRFSIKCPTYSTNRHRARLYDVTHDTVIRFGSSEYAASNSAGANSSVIVGEVVLSETTDLRVEHRAQTTNTNFGLGVDADFGDTEQYMTAEFIRK